MKKKTKNILIISMISSIVLILFSLFIYNNYFTMEAKYNRCYGEEGKYRNYYHKVMYNDIFPTSIESKDVIAFKFNDYFWFENHVGYLVIKYEPNEYQQEVNRLKSLESSEDYFIYGTEGFNKDLCAIYSYSNDVRDGLRYALADNKNSTISYIDIIYTDHYSGIDYTKMIPQEDLPVGFNALDDNPTQIAYRKRMGFID